MKEAKVKHTRFNVLLWRKLPPCREIVKIITASMDAKLSWREWVLMKLHLLSCDPCVNFLKQINFIRTALDHSDEGMDDALQHISLSHAARERMKDALDSANTAS
ncbi:MAG: zf-HC2 domain-containing protein [Blastocatellia bacterium]|nr:zf-HC2 domain-containing protein [Chloracidobacterium sp.]MBL8184739.1 zf-HC2 domain-containing protein [Blastocatellia bacterium]HRJ90114.1 hypothetical protein [Pyrinomonadaceae bacterium]HRK49333.1 hypothetical protein [Pyrinomonadaceae bacterium]